VLDGVNDGGKNIPGGPVAFYSRALPGGCFVPAGPRNDSV
jgi:hypothetical protein